MTILRTAALAACLCALWFAPQSISRTNDPSTALAMQTGLPVNIGMSPAAYERPACVVTYWWMSREAAS